jgi:hypothetical protein
MNCTACYDDPAYADKIKELKAELQRLRDHYQVVDNPPVRQPRKRSK